MPPSHFQTTAELTFDGVGTQWLPGLEDENQDYHERHKAVRDDIAVCAFGVGTFGLGAFGVCAFGVGTFGLGAFGLQRYGCSHYI